jgi:phenylalanyl-tRNA synthetase beta chain
VLGHFGELHPDVLEAFDVKGPVAAFEVFLDAAPLPRAAKGAPTRDRAPLRLSVFQPVERDFAFIVDRGLPAETLLRAARGADRKLVSDIRLFDVYEGQGLPEGKKSLAITVTLQPQQATLTESEIDSFSRRLVTAVEKATGGTLRG